ncbi:hypothetical protein SAMN04488543_3939 [Friedmanniella luteola]|uniref:Lipoprotein n=1 Tax=Friedmanniella luteola TaxID=546871 RepID=A0A1H1ZQS5_9ACTN|nr:hypothetical protein [Friedmanniella luteola]SDT36000.1 hypothetical protein SAMN04488543_3939 [Friedmanniella luteola]
MRTERHSRRGPGAAGGTGTRRGTCAAALAGLLLGLVPACATPPADGEPHRPASRSARPSPEPATAGASAAAWVDRCVQQVRYWVQEIDDHPDHSDDYQEMGLSDAAYGALHDVLRDQRSSGGDASPSVRVVRSACRARAPTPAGQQGPGWR